MDGGLLTYEELKGGHGKRVVYRSTRHDPASVFGDELPRVSCGDAVVHVENLSSSGVALRWDAMSKTLPAIGERVSISFDYAGDTILDMPCIACRVDDSDAGAVVGFRFDGDLLNIPQLKNRARHSTVALQARRAVCTDPSLVSLEYRGFCADVLMFLRKYRTLTQDNAGIARTADDEKAVFEACKEPFLEEWKGLSARGNKLVRACEGDAARALAEREYAVDLLRPEFESARIWNALVSSGGHGLSVQDIASGRTPRMYDDAGAFERLLQEAANTVLRVFNNRMASVVAYIAEQARRAEPGSVLRVASFAGGGGVELRELEVAIQGLDVIVEVNILDWREALLQESYSMQMASDPSNVRLRHTLLSPEALAQGTLADLAHTNDIIYSSAVCDGMKDTAFADHVRALEQYVHKAGSVLITGLIDDDFCPRWALEHLAGCTPRYRDADKICQLLRANSDRLVCYAHGLGDGVVCLKGTLP